MLLPGSKEGNHMDEIKTLYLMPNDLGVVPRFFACTCKLGVYDKNSQILLTES